MRDIFLITVGVMSLATAGALACEAENPAKLALRQSPLRIAPLAGFERCSLVAARSQIEILELRENHALVEVVVDESDAPPGRDCGRGTRGTIELRLLRAVATAGAAAGAQAE